MAAHVSAIVRNCVPILGIDLAFMAKGRAMKVRNDSSNRGAGLLVELKALLDSFPLQVRTNVIETLKIVFRGLNGEPKTRRSVQPQPEANSVLSKPHREAPANAELSHKRHSEEQEQKEGGER